MATLKYKDKTNDVWKKISGYIQLGNDVPIGTILPFSGTTIPDGYLSCNGSSLLRTDYPDLFNVIGTTYGSVDNTHFNLPNIQGKIPVGLDTTDTDFNVLGKTGGEKTHTLTIDEMPSHNHKFKRTGAYGTSSNHTGMINEMGATNYESLDTGSTGGGQAHNNMPPYIVQNFIIKAKMSGTINKNNTYSTSESKTGETWINGKPIYRKVVIIPNVTATQATYDLSSIPIDICMVNTSNSFFAQGNYILPIVSYGTNTDWSRAFFEVSTKKLYVQFGSVYTMSKNIYITIEYTKTTD